MTYPTLHHERQLWNDGYTVIGVDEVGRGALAGPVHVCAFAITPGIPDKTQKDILSLKINDSKKLSPKKREHLCNELNNNRLVLNSIGTADADCINTSGIVTALEKAACQAVERLISKLNHNKYYVLIDGNKSNCIKSLALPQLPIIKGDSISLSIAAASVLAKVQRDAYMTQLSLQYPQYFWQINKGYGTKTHREAIQKHGSSPHHRLLYLRKLPSTLNMVHA